MSKNLEMSVESRKRAGKGSSRAIRREGYVPAVIYGDKKEPVMVKLKRNELIRLINRGEFINQLIQVSIDGGEHERVLPRDLQVHPVSDDPIHVDFLRIGEGVVFVFEVPVHIVGEDECPGIAKGGLMNIVRHTIEVRCRARDLPENLVVNIAGMDIGDIFHASNLELPEGTELALTDRDFTVATIASPTIEVEKDDEDEDAVEGAEGENEGEGEESSEGGEE